MKVELDLSEEQLKGLDEDLTSVLKNLSEEQKVSIIQAYLIDKFNKFEYTYTTSWGSKETKISDFGKQLIDGLQNKIEDSISNKILEDEKLKSFIKDTIDNVEANLQNTIEKAISEYITENLFSNTNKIRYFIQEEFQSRRDPNTGRIY